MSTRMPASPSPRPAPGGRLLARLGVHGLGTLEPVIIAALATESPLLLVGPHGTAKSRLLLRLAEALGLTCRHYNASLLSFDDLVGYPLPDERGELRFVRTPASIWDAHVVFLDEISRCRPDVQNRVFSIIHERRVQGMALPLLRHRWAAMNPPASDESRAAGGDEYLGAEPLDVALADRFPFVVLVPSWDAFTADEQVNVLLETDEPVPDDAAADLRVAVAEAQGRADSLRRAFAPQVARYVRLLVPLLATAGCAVSPRRAGMILRNVIAVHAACLGIDPTVAPASSAWLALQWSLPSRAGSATVAASKLLVAHREAWLASGLDELDPRVLLLAERDPVARAVLAAESDGLDDTELSTHVADGLAAASPGERHALATHLMTLPSAGRLHAAVAEQLARLHAATVVGAPVLEVVQNGSARHAAWTAIEALVARVPRGRKRTRAGNLLATLFVEGEIHGQPDAQDALAAWFRTGDRLSGAARASA